MVWFGAVVVCAVVVGVAAFGDVVVGVVRHGTIVVLRYTTWDSMVAMADSAARSGGRACCYQKTEEHARVLHFVVCVEFCGKSWVYARMLTGMGMRRMT